MLWLTTWTPTLRIHILLWRLPLLQILLARRFVSPTLLPSPERVGPKRSTINSSKLYNCEFLLSVACNYLWFFVYWCSCLILPSESNIHVRFVFFSELLYNFRRSFIFLLDCSSLDSALLARLWFEDLTSSFLNCDGFDFCVPALRHTTSHIFVSSDFFRINIMELWF